MGRKRHAQRLIIWMNGTPVAYWDAGRGQDTLTYYDAWLADDAARPLSLSLPFLPDNAPHRGAAVKNYFDNLLPDSDAIRARIAQRFKVDGTEPHRLLAAVGRDCVGAIQLLPENETPRDLFTIQGESLTEADVAGILRNTVAAPGLGLRHDDDLRLSIAGAQEKSALLWHAGSWRRPEGSTPTTHILKLPMGVVGGSVQADMRTSVENEWLCAQIVAAFGLPVAHCEIAMFEDMKALVVERFDRRPANDGSWIIRLPQEDFCQATGTSPVQKYQSDGGPGPGTIMNILLGSDAAVVDRTNFFRAQMIFWLLAATDGHAKNFSIFLMPGSRFRMTPLYDVLSAHPVIGKGAHRVARKKVKLAMAVRGSTNYYLLDQIQRRHWLAHARQLGLGAAAAETVMEDLLANVEVVIERVAAALPADYPQHVADAIFDGLRQQAERLAVLAS